MVFAVESTQHGAHLVVAVIGDVDIATAAPLRERLAAALAESRSVVVDLAHVPFLDSTGLGVLVGASNRATAASRAFVLARPQPIVRNALRLVQVDSLIDVYDSLDAALAVVQG